MIIIIITKCNTGFILGGESTDAGADNGSLADVVKALNALGASPRDLVAIFQALEGAGALPAKLVVQ